MKNILYISRNIPDNLLDGSGQRTLAIYDSLSKLGNVYRVVPVWEKSLEKRDDLSRIQWLNVRPEGKFSNFIYKLMHKTIWKSMPMLSRTFFPQRILEKIWPGIHFDVVVIRYTEMALLFQPWKLAPVIIDVDDYPLELLDKSYSGTWLKKKIYRYCLQRLLKRTYSRCRELWVSNSEHCALLEKYASVSCLENLAQPVAAGYQIKGKQEKILLTVGNLGYPPNYLGINRFFKEYWEKIKKYNPEWQWYIVGGHIRKQDRDRWGADSAVHLEGYVEDLTPYYEKCMFVVAPVYSGSGTCIKVIEALMHGRICLGPDFAFRGIEENQQKIINGILNYQNMTGDQLLSVLQKFTDKDIVYNQEQIELYARQRFSSYHFNKIIESSLQKIVVE